MKKGFITIHRSLLDWEWYTDLNTKSLFIHLLLKANHQEGNWRGHLVKRGSLITGRSELAKSIGLTEQQVRTSLNKLKKTNEITIKPTNNFSIIELVNYSLYQAEKKPSNQPNNQPSTNEQPTSNQQVTTNNNENNENNENKPHQDGVVLKSFEGGIGEFRKLLTEDVYLKTEIKMKSLNRDFLNLIGVYISWIKQAGLPDDINKAFPKWCESYTKGKSL